MNGADCVVDPIPPAKNGGSSRRKSKKPRMEIPVESEEEEEEEEELESLVESVSADEVEEVAENKKSPSPVPTAATAEATDEAASESDISTSSTANGVLSCEVTIHTGDKSSTAASTASAIVVVGAPSVD